MIVVFGSVLEVEPTVMFVQVPKIANELIVDTNGAGDSLVGGFFASLIAGKSVVESVETGIELSGIVIQRSGC